MSCEALFLKELHQRGFRLTPQREMVLLVLHRIGHPASAEEIFARVGEKSASVEISTIYRTLDLLSSLNLVSVIDTGDKQRLYELIGAHTPAARSAGLSRNG
jgi:Fur family ferric uptake transcriptional regulator